MVAHDGQVAVEVRHGNAADHHERHPGRACEPGRGLPGPPRRTVTAATAGDQPILQEGGMRYGVLGTGMVGRALAGALVADGAEVRMGARQQGNEMALDWAAGAGERASTGDSASAAAYGEIVINATAGSGSLAALRAAGLALDGKVLIDVANPIAPDSGFPPALSIVNTDSLGELIQREFPAARVVKTLNTVNAEVMVQPTLVPGDHTIFVCGNDADAKGTVVDILAGFGWPTGAVSTSATSRRLGGRRCTWRCGCG